jgi:hypothetical protein
MSGMDGWVGVKAVLRIAYSNQKPESFDNQSGFLMIKNKIANSSGIRFVSNI